MCIEQIIGTEFYFVLITAFVGSAMSLIKRLSFVPSDGVPIIAFVLGWILDSLAAQFLCNNVAGQAWITGLGGGMAGLAASGGYEILMRMAKMVGVEQKAEWLLGRAGAIKREREKESEIVMADSGSDSDSNAAGM